MIHHQQLQGVEVISASSSSFVTRSLRSRPRRKVIEPVDIGALQSRVIAPPKVPESSRRRDHPSCHQGARGGRGGDGGRHTVSRSSCPASIAIPPATVTER